MEDLELLKNIFLRFGMSLTDVVAHPIGPIQKKYISTRYNIPENKLNNLLLALKDTKKKTTLKINKKIKEKLEKAGINSEEKLKRIKINKLYSLELNSFEFSEVLNYLKSLGKNLENKKLF